MVFTCLFYSSRNGARRRRVDALISLAPADPSRSDRAAAPRGDPSRSSGACARPPPFGGRHALLLAPLLDRFPRRRPRIRGVATRPSGKGGLGASQPPSSLIRAIAAIAPKGTVLRAYQDKSAPVAGSQVG